MGRILLIRGHWQVDNAKAMPKAWRVYVIIGPL